MSNVDGHEVRCPKRWFGWFIRTDFDPDRTVVEATERQRNHPLEKRKGSHLAALGCLIIFRQT